MGNYSGQIAQQVEQGTENPRVGGSIPSLATPFRAPPRLLAAVALLFSGCGFLQDDCERLCDEVADALTACADPSWSWEDLEVRGPFRFAFGCRRAWDDQKVNLATRDLELALAQCDDGRTLLTEMTCDELLELYVGESAPQGSVDTDL